MGTKAKINTTMHKSIIAIVDDYETLYGTRTRVIAAALSMFHGATRDQRDEAIRRIDAMERGQKASKSEDVLIGSMFESVEENEQSATKKKRTGKGAA